MKDQLEMTREQTQNQPSEILEAAKVEDRPVNRLLKIHEAAQQELQDLEADFQIQLQESILQAESHFSEKFATASQDFQRREQEIQATANQRFQKTTEEFGTERSEFQQRIAALEEQIDTKKKAQQVPLTPLSRQLEVKLKEITLEKARLEEELEEVNAYRKAEAHRLQKLKTSKALPRIWEL
jgi:hypothetical protein